MRNHQTSSPLSLAGLTCLLLTIYCGGFCRDAHGSLIAYDPFNQTATASIAGTASTSPGVWPTGSQDWGNVAGTVGVSSGSLSVPSGVQGLSTDGNRATLTNSAGAQVAAFRQFGVTYTTSVGNNDNLWLSFLYQPASRTGGQGLNEGISLFSGSTEMLFIGAEGVGDIAIRAIGGQSADIDRFANTFVDATSNQTFQIVANIRNTTEYTIWVDPTGFNHSTGLPTGGTRASLITGLSSFSFDRIRLGDDTTASALGSATFDEFRLGTTAAAVVPEPATCVLCFTALACGCWQLARRSRTGSRNMESRRRH